MFAVMRVWVYFCEPVLVSFVIFSMPVLALRSVARAGASL